MAKRIKIPKGLVAQMDEFALKTAGDPASVAADGQEPVDEAPAPGHDPGPAPAPPGAAASEGPLPGAAALAAVEPTPAVPPEAVPLPAPEPQPRKKKPGEFSENDLEDWTARVAAMQQAREQARREAAERQATKKEQAAAWRTLRRLVEEASQPQRDPVPADPLAQRVQQAPKKLRAVIDAVLTAHGC